MQVYTTDTHLVIVMEYVAGGRFERLLAKEGRLPEKEARRYFGQLIDAVAYCHEQVQLPSAQHTCFAEQPTARVGSAGSDTCKTENRQCQVAVEKDSDQCAVRTDPSSAHVHEGHQFNAIGA